MFAVETGVDIVARILITLAEKGTTPEYREQLYTFMGFTTYK